MLVYLHRYREDGANDTVEHGDDVVDTSSEEYFGEEELGPDEWERITYGDRTILRKAETYEGVTAVSAPEDVDEPGSLPGADIQLRIDGGEKFVEQALIVEVTDDDP
jgi:hypothetical protein